MDPYAFAAEKHAGQFRKGAGRDPYINHLAEVAALVREATGDSDENLVTASLLHDVVEDSDTTFDQIATRFGEAVAALVAELTDEDGLTEGARRQAQVDHCPQLSSRAKIVKLADKISNLKEMHRDPPAGWSVERRMAYLEWGEACFAGLRGVHAGLETKFLVAARQLRKQLQAEG